MERREFVYILLLTVSVMTSIHSHATLSSSSVGSCSPVQKSDLGGFFPSIEGIVPATFKSANGSGAPHVQIIKYHTVCEVPGRMKNTVGHLSVLVKYLCFGSNCPQNGGTSTNPQAVISQFQIQCHADTNTFLSSSGIASSIRGSTRVDHATADFSIANDTQCGACVDPATGTSGDQNNDPDTFCGACVNCNEGQRRCIGNDADNQCCNWYFNDECYITCPSGLTGNTETFECDCGNLSVPNGVVSFTDRFQIGSVATHSCNEGYLPDTNITVRTCGMTGWNNYAFNCQAISCETVVDPCNGHVTVNGTTYGSYAVYTCEEGFVLQGDNVRTCGSDGSWNGSSPICVATTTVMVETVTEDIQTIMENYTVLNVANDGGVAIKMDFAFQLLTLTVIIISYYN